MAWTGVLEWQEVKQILWFWVNVHSMGNKWMSYFYWELCDQKVKPSRKESLKSSEFRQKRSGKTANTNHSPPQWASPPVHCGAPFTSQLADVSLKCEIELFSSWPLLYQTFNVYYFLLVCCSSCKGVWGKQMFSFLSQQK